MKVKGKRRNIAVVIELTMDEAELLHALLVDDPRGLSGDGPTRIKCLKSDMSFQLTSVFNEDYGKD